jgi:hypothetical protein
MVENKLRTESELAYAAGILDGEGTIGLGTSYNKYKERKYKRYRLQCRIVNTDARMVLWLREKFGGYMAIIPKSPPRMERYEWRLQDKKAASFLELVEPYSVIKKEQIKIALDFRSTIDQRKGTKRRVPKDTNDIRDKMFNDLKTLHLRSDNKLKK